MAELFSLIFNCFTIGITTAEDVPPIIAPIKTELIQSSLVNKLARKAVMITVITKLIMVSREAAPIYFFYFTEF